MAGWLAAHCWTPSSVMVVGCRSPRWTPASSTLATALGSFHMNRSWSCWLRAPQSTLPLANSVNCCSCAPCCRGDPWLLSRHCCFPMDTDAVESRNFSSVCSMSSSPFRIVSTTCPSISFWSHPWRCHCFPSWSSDANPSVRLQNGKKNFNHWESFLASTAIYHNQRPGGHSHHKNSILIEWHFLQTLSCNCSCWLGK